MPDAQHVLRVDRRVVARAAGGDDHLLDAALADRLGERGDDRGRAAQEPRRDLGLLEDLVAERHPARVCPTTTGSRPTGSASPASAAASASSEPGRIE